MPREKEAQVRKILDTYHQDQANWRKENEKKLEELNQQIQAAKTAGDKEKEKTLTAQQRELVASHLKLREDVLKQLGKVLNEEQMAKVKAALGGGEMGRPFERIHNDLRPLKLTDAQQAAVKEILDKARQEIRASEKGQGQVDAIVKAAWTKIVKDVLTDQQRQQLKSIKKEESGSGTKQWGEAFLARLKTLNLTADQQKKVDEIMAKARLEAQQADSPEAKQKIHRQAINDIRQNVLTKDQLKQLPRETATKNGAGE